MVLDLQPPVDDLRGPRGTDLELRTALVVGHRAEAVGGDAGDRAGSRAVRRAVRGQSLGEPRPPHGRERRVGDHLEVDLGARVADAAERAVPRVVAGRVVQQDQAAGAHVDAVDGHVGAQRRGVRRDPLGRRHRLAQHLRAQPGLGHGAHRLLELRRVRWRARSGARLWAGDHDLTVGGPSTLWCEHAGCRSRGRRDSPRHSGRELPPIHSQIVGDYPAMATSHGFGRAWRDWDDAVMTSPHDSVFLRAARGESVDHTPVWFMRQAGRSLPEYLKLREGVGMLESCMDPALTTEITLQPVRRYGVDAAIFFSDIVLPLKAVGVDLDIKPGVGPVVPQPVRTLEDVAATPDLTPEHVPFTTAAITSLVAELGATPLIGFAGAPFTVASYLVEGGPSKEHAKTKAMMFGAPDVWDALMRKIAGISAAYLRVQVEAGASAVQLFDSWAGALTPADYRASVMPHSARVLAAAGELGVPRIHFGVSTGELLGLMGDAGADVVGVDWRVALDAARERGGPTKAVQGNLDPAVLFAPWDVVEREARAVLARAGGGPGHIFNLGHGVLPD